VFPDSAAERAGIKPGDRLTQIADKPVANLEEALAAMNARKVSEELEVIIEREGEPQTLKVTLSDLSAVVPDELPPLEQPQAEEASELAGVSEIKLPEETTTSFVYAPENYSAEQSYGLVVWLQSPGAFEEKPLLAQWKETCNERGLILLAPHPANSARWLPTEVDFVSKSIAAAQDRYSIDPQRIVVYGEQAGGSMAYLVALGKRELIRGVAARDAAVPMRGPAPENEPTMRLAIFSAVPADSKLAERINSVMKLLAEKKFPVTNVELPAGSEKLSDEAFDKLVRWLDSLDRF
jgi:membrane-associated protease RseP (regulator of RpoE activity)